MQRRLQRWNLEKFTARMHTVTYQFELTIARPRERLIKGFSAVGTISNRLLTARENSALSGSTVWPQPCKFSPVLPKLHQRSSGDLKASSSQSHSTWPSPNSSPELPTVTESPNTVRSRGSPSVTDRSTCEHANIELCAEVCDWSLMLAMPSTSRLTLVWPGLFRTAAGTGKAHVAAPQSCRLERTQKWGRIIAHGLPLF